MDTQQPLSTLGDINSYTKILFQVVVSILESVGFPRSKCWRIDGLHPVKNKKNKGNHSKDAEKYN